MRLFIAFIMVSALAFIAIAQTPEIEAKLAEKLTDSSAN